MGLGEAACMRSTDKLGLILSVDIMSDRCLDPFCPACKNHDVLVMCYFLDTNSFSEDVT